MSQRFVRCAHCGLPHDVNEVRCPATGLPIKPTRFSAVAQRGPGSVPKIAAAQVPSFDAVPPRPTPKPPPVPSPVLPPAGKRSLVGRVIGDKYGVTAVIGEGGMGAVYEAEHLTIGRLVALKVLHPANAKRPDAVARFHHEARVAGSIGHPNICEIFDVGKLEDGSPYLVMERLHGETLADRIAREGALLFGDVLDIVLQVLSALSAAHAKGVVHRDIKPENIFLSERARIPGAASGSGPIAKLLDFGISKVGDGIDLSLTRTGMVMGTPYYMAPEQARGDPTIDHRVDLYAIGVILYESLTGRRPFLAPNYNALLVQILSGIPRPIRELRPAVPQALDAIIEKAMSKSRDRRYQSANEFLDALSNVKAELTRGPDPAEFVMAAGPLRRSSSPPPRRPSEPPPSVEIPVHFSPGTESGQYASVSSGELLPSCDPVTDTDPSSASTAIDDHPTLDDVPPIPRRSERADDTHVEPRPLGEDWVDKTEVIPPLETRPPEGETPVHGVELAVVRRNLNARARPLGEATSKSRPLDDREAEEIIRAANAKRRADAKPLAKNPLRPAAVPTAPKPPEKPIPREDPNDAALRPPSGASERPEDDDAPTTFFRPRKPMPSAEELGEEDEIPESRSPFRTEPAPPPTPTGEEPIAPKR